MNDELEMTDIEIIVASRAEACDLLGPDADPEAFSFVVSIGDPEDEPPAGYRRVRNGIRLSFYDTYDEYGPSERDVERLIHFAREISNRRGKVLTHCQAGISRSSAAAYIIYAIAAGPGGEEEALRRVYAQRPMASPNRRMVQIADELLGRDGAMIDALDEVMRD